MNKWLEAVALDVKGQEDKQRLTPDERVRYSLYLGAICVAGALAAMPVGWWPVSIVLGAIGARKLQIYVHKRRHA